MLEHLGGDDPVEGAVGEREVQGVALDGAAAGRLGAELAGVGHGPEGVPDPGHLLGPGVEGHHGRPAPGRLEGVAAEPAPQVEQAVAGPDPEPVVVDGQHVASPAVPAAAGTPVRTAPGRGRPSIRAA